MKRDARQGSGGLMQRFGRKVHPRRDNTAFIVAIGRHDVECGRGTKIDDNQRALMRMVRGNGVHQSVGADGLRPVDAHGDAEIDIGIADDHRFTLGIATTQIAQVKQRVRHNRSDDRRINCGKG